MATHPSGWMTTDSTSSGREGRSRSGAGAWGRMRAEVRARDSSPAARSRGALLRIFAVRRGIVMLVRSRSAARKAALAVHPSLWNERRE